MCFEHESTSIATCNVSVITLKSLVADSGGALKERCPTALFILLVSKLQCRYRDKLSDYLSGQEYVDKLQQVRVVLVTVSLTANYFRSFEISLQFSAPYFRPSFYYGGQCCEYLKDILSKFVS